MSIMCFWKPVEMPHNCQRAYSENRMKRAQLGTKLRLRERHGCLTHVADLKRQRKATTATKAVIVGDTLYLTQWRRKCGRKRLTWNKEEILER